MPACLDHIVVVAHSLDAGADRVEQALGVRPGPGRKHAHMGTHNLLLALGPGVYLEVVAVDPEATPPSRPRWFGLDDWAPQHGARLAAWVAGTDRIGAVDDPRLGPVETMQRAGLRWQMTVMPDGRLPLSGAAPLLIQRETNAHPAAALPESNLRLRELRIRHPEPAEVSALLSKIGLLPQPRVVVEPGATCALMAEVQTPSGSRLLR